MSGVVHGAHLSFLDPQGPVAAAQRAHFMEVILLTIIVVFPVLVLAPLIAWRYRLRNTNARYTPNWSFSRVYEVLIWGVPFAIVITLSIRLWQSTHKLDPYVALFSAKPSLHVQVVGYDWKWLFIYPDLGIASIGRLALPAGQPITFDLTSDTVLQSFFIPALGGQIYAMPAMVTHLNLEANSPGEFLGENVQYNGTHFFQQKFTAEAMTPAAFKDWSTGIKAHGIPLDAAALQEIGKRSTAEQTRKALDAGTNPEGVIYFRDVPAGLFHSITASFHNGMSMDTQDCAASPVPGRSSCAPASGATHH